ncbi:helix-turn-helix transcriptional regulator [Bacillus sp. S3]|uniref:ArsR/SmtB family transcription factor n=1 Tax=Bacillus sp. S3 TaxID=486398 RepID=UPI00118BAB3E|nr:ArsR family transcriptional regulator [Bacillus sp. S3]QCJ44576.1 helix-turn-helix transcriptional regulator [Bacillus sp. S3]
MNGIKLEIEFSESNELITSLLAFKTKSLHKGIQLGNSWVRTVKGKLSETTLELIANTELKESILNLLLLACPKKDSVHDLLEWIGDVSIGEIFEQVSTWTSEETNDLRNINEWRSNIVQLLSLWYEEYYQHLDPSIINSLTKNAQKNKELLKDYKPIDLIEEITNGLRLEFKVKRIILIPQYHISPYNLTYDFNGLTIIYYSTQIEQVNPDFPSLSILNIARALMDENRLRILRYLTNGEKKFTEIVQFIGLAKSTVHYHMVTLRSAGLVRVHVYSQGRERYSLRSGALNKFNSGLTSYLGLEKLKLD